MQIEQKSKYLFEFFERAKLKDTNNSPYLQALTKKTVKSLVISEKRLIFVPEFWNFTFKIMNNIESATGEIVMYQPDETIRLEVRMGEETVWLTQQQMAELFQRDQSVIARHIRNIYKEEELDEEGTYAKFAYMGHDGLQMYEVNHYNLDVIISVGYLWAW